MRLRRLGSVFLLAQRSAPGRDNDSGLLSNEREGCYHSSKKGCTVVDRLSIDRLMDCQPHDSQTMTIVPGDDLFSFEPIPCLRREDIAGSPTSR
jgi:hypothetical protein